MSEELRGWQELVEYFGREFGLLPGDEADDGHGFVRFPMKIGTESTRVGVFRLRIRNEAEWVGLALKICPANKIRPTSALIKNYDLTVGALCFGSDTLIVRQTLPLDVVPVAHIQQTLQGLAEVYRQVREVLANPPREDDPNPYGYLLR